MFIKFSAESPLRLLFEKGKRDIKMTEIEPLRILTFFYPENTPLRRLLLSHSEQVREKALEILRSSGRNLDAEQIATGAMLHDIGIGKCHAPSILCEGSADYIAHGIIGSEMLREYGRTHGLDLEPFARICERHTGSGLTAMEIRRQNLPIPERDYLPETPEEKLICLADKFFSKSGDRKEKTLEHIRRSMEKFGADSLRRFDEMCLEFGISRPNP